APTSWRRAWSAVMAGASLGIARDCNGDRGSASSPARGRPRPRRSPIYFWPWVYMRARSVDIAYIGQERAELVYKLGAARGWDQAAFLDTLGHVCDKSSFIFALRDGGGASGGV